MEPSTAPTISEVVVNISKLVAEVSTITTVVSLGMTQFIKQFTVNSKVIAAFAVIFGFVAGSLIMKIFGQNFFSAISLLVSGVAALGAPGVFSVVKALTTPSTDVTPQA